MLHRVVALVLASLPFSAFAYQLNILPLRDNGANEIVAPAGTYGAVQTGWNAEPGGNVGSVNGSTGGNAIVLTGVSDQVVSEAVLFTLSWTDLSNNPAGTANIDVTSVTTVAAYCAAVDAHPDLNCSVRPEGVQILVPFLKKVASFSFTHADVPGRASNFTISNIAPTGINRFQIRVNGTLYTEALGPFASVAQAAAAIDALSYVRTGTVTATSIEILANAEGSTTFADIRLDAYTPAVRPSLHFYGLDDSLAATADRIVLGRDGAQFDIALAAADLTGIAQTIDAHASLSADVDGDTLHIHFDPAGEGTPDGSFWATPKISGGSSFASTENITVTMDPAMTLTLAGGDMIVAADVRFIGGYQASEDVLAATSSSLLVSYASGVLSIIGPGTVAEFQDALRSITYTNTSDTPTGVQRTIQISIGDGPSISAPHTYTTTPSAVDDPTSMLFAGAPLLYVENQGAVAIDGTLTLSDPDTTTLAGASVTLVGALPTEDVLAFASSDNVRGVVLDGVLTLSGVATLAEYESVLRSVTYTNTSEAPSSSGRTAMLILGGRLVEREIVIMHTDDPPALTLSPGDVTYTENGATLVDSGLDLADPDDVASGATVTITGYVAGEDFLVFSDQNGIAGVFSNGTLTLSGTATTEQYREALRSVVYQNASDAPNTGDRVMTFSAMFGLAAASNARTVHIVPVNDPPVLSGTSFEDLALTDPDDGDMASATARITSGTGTLLFSTALESSFDPALVRATFRGAGSRDAYLAAFASLSLEAAPGEYELALQVDDGEAQSNVLTLALTIAPAPAVDMTPADGGDDEGRESSAENAPEVGQRGCAASESHFGFLALVLLFLRRSAR